MLARFWQNPIGFAIVLLAGQGLAEGFRFMSGAKDKVIHLHRRDPQEALERLNRITGLKFVHWPESLAGLAVQESETAFDDQPAPPPVVSISRG